MMIEKNAFFGQVIKGHPHGVVEPVEQSAIETANRTFDASRELALRVAVVVDRIVGLLPTAGCDAKQESPVDGVFPQLKRRANDTLDVVHLAHDALYRLERALP